MAANYYVTDYDYGYGYDMGLPSAEAIIAMIKQIFWNRVVPSRAINCVRSIFSEAPTWTTTGLSIIHTHKKQISILFICGGVFYLAQRVALKDSKGKGDCNDAAGGTVAELNSSPQTPHANDNATKPNVLNKQEIERELYVLLIDGNFGRTDIIEQYTQAHRVAAQNQTGDGPASAASSSNTSLIYDEDYDTGESETTSDDSINQQNSELQFGHEN